VDEIINYFAPAILKEGNQSMLVRYAGNIMPMMADLSDAL
jgi:hypothetical protein